MSHSCLRIPGLKDSDAAWRYSAVVLFAIISGQCAPFSAQAAEEVDSLALSPEQLFDATVMSVSKTPEKVIDAPAAVFVLKGEDILRSGATSIPEALRLVPGVQVAQVGSSSWAISVRGFNGTLANKLLVLIDGREVYNPLFSGVYWDVQDTPLEDIDRIEVVRGPGASLWGANAVNGVINIITKNAADTQGGMVSALAGNQDKAITTGRYGGTFGDNGFYRIYGKYTDRGDESAVSGGSAQDGWQQQRAGWRADWKSGDKNTFTFQGDVYRSNESDLTSLPLLTNPYALTQIDDVTARGANMLGRWADALDNGGRFTLQSYLDYTYRDQILLTDQRTTFDIDAQYEFPYWERQAFITGLHYRYSAGNITNSPYLTTITDPERNDQTFSGFVQDKITLEPERWFLTLGSKLEHNDYTGFEIQPNARLQWHPSDSQMVWTSVARAVRTPTRLEQGVDINLGTLPPSLQIPLPVTLELLANRNFDSESLRAYELGYRQQLTPKLSLDVATFYNTYNGLSTDTFLPATIATDPLHFILPFDFTNDTTATTYGGEATLDWRALHNLDLSTSYSLLEMDLYGPPSSVAISSESAEHQSPQHQLNFRSQWDATDALSLDTMLYYVSALPDYDVKSYWRLDLRGAWKITNGLEFSLVGQNLLDGSHREFSAPTDVGATRIGQTFYGKITWHF